MDHLPIPDTSKHEIVPYLDYGLRYDFKGFLGFPSRIGLDLDDLTSSGSKFRASTLLDEGHFRLTNALTLEGHFDFSKIVLKWYLAYYDRSSRSVPKTGLNNDRHFKPCFKDTLVEDLCEKGYFMQTRILTLEGHFDPDTAIPLWINTFVQQWLYFGILVEFESAMGLPMDWSQTTSKISPGSWRIDTNWMANYGRTLVTELLYQHNVPIDLKEGDWVYVDLPDGMSRANIHQSERRIWEEKKVEHNLIDPQSTQVGPFQVIEVGRTLYCRLLDFQERPIKVTKLHHASRAQGITSKTEYFSIASTFSLHELIWTGYAILTTEGKTPKAQLRESLRAASRYLTHIAEDNTAQIFRTDVVMAIDIVYDSINCALRRLFGQNPENRYFSSVHEHLESKMTRNKWCPSLGSKLFTLSNTSDRYVASCLDSYDDRSHVGCTTKLCQLRLLDVQHMKLAHNESCCTQTCDLVTFDEARTIEILKNKGIPGIRQQSSTGGTREFILCDIRGAEYTAISHVWSHGLCNPEGTALYYCQLDDLFKKVSAVKGQRKDVLVWIDTICIPSDPYYKISAIADMKVIYTNAETVLILDRKLSRVGSSFFERRFHLFACEWQTRLWTMQEARLAKAPWVQFKDEAVPVSQLAEKMKPSNIRDLDFDLFHTVSLDTSESIGAQSKISENVFQKWNDLCQDMTYRSTTVSTDEPIVLAVAFGLDLFNKGMPPSMEDVYGASLQVSRNLLFVPSGRLKTKGLRWAPSTLLNQGEQAFLNTGIDDATAWSLPMGLLTSAHALIIDDPLDICLSDEGMFQIVSVSDDLQIMLKFRSENFSNHEDHVLIERPVMMLMLPPDMFTVDSLTNSRGIIADLANESLSPLESLGKTHGSSSEDDLLDRINQKLSRAHACRFIGQAEAKMFSPATMELAKWTLAKRNIRVGPPVSGRLEAQMLVCID